MSPRETMRFLKQHGVLLLYGFLFLYGLISFFKDIAKLALRAFGF